jgi:hypothetical protein
MLAKSTTVTPLPTNVSLWTRPSFNVDHLSAMLMNLDQPKLLTVVQFLPLKHLHANNTNVTPQQQSAQSI